MSAVFIVTTLGKQAIILGSLWLEAENPDINWKNQTLHWRANQTREIRTVDLESYEEPTYNLAISFIKGEATEETRQCTVEPKGWEKTTKKGGCCKKQ